MTQDSLAKNDAGELIPKAITGSTMSIAEEKF
jgi:hypothetical protein